MQIHIYTNKLYAYVGAQNVMVSFLTDLKTCALLVIVARCTTHTGMCLVIFYMKHEDMYFSIYLFTLNIMIVLQST